MPKKIDELFSPDRLQKSWQKTKERADGSVRTEKEGESPLEVYNHLRGLIHRSFSGDDLMALNLLMDDLYSLLKQIYPNAEESLVPADSATDVLPAVHDILNRIEDLVEAYEIAGRGRK